MDYDDVLRHFGGGTDIGSLARAAKRLRIPKGTVAAWKKRGVPRGRQFQFQVMTRGRLRAD